MMKQVRNIGLNSNTLYFASIASVALSIGIWFLQRGEDRSRAERFGIFVGLWAPTLMIMGKAIEDSEIAEMVEEAASA
ncbi:MAG: hypothetical protein AAFV33_00655 [Chloroflexota bacterium]